MVEPSTEGEGKRATPDTGVGEEGVDRHDTLFPYPHHDPR